MRWCTTGHRHQNQSTTTRVSGPTPAKWGHARSLRATDTDSYRRCCWWTHSLDLLTTTGQSSFLFFYDYRSCTRWSVPPSLCCCWCWPTMGLNHIRKKKKMHGTRSCEQVLSASWLTVPSTVSDLAYWVQCTYWLSCVTSLHRLKSHRENKSCSLMGCV